MHLRVTDPSGLAVKANVQIVSEANQYRNKLATNDQGSLHVQRLPFGIYQIEIRQAGFSVVSESVEIRSSIPTERTIELKLASANESVTVAATNTLIDPDQAGAVSQIGADLIQNRLSSLPGRSLQDLVNSQPGWLYEGNAVLHPRGSEYQTQFVVDGIPLTDNRSPSFGPEIAADDVQSMSIYTAGIPAEYGRKMGGVVEVNTLQDSQAGFHGQVVLSGGSFDSAGAFAQGQYVWGKNTFGGSASGSMTDHYLNPVVPQNYTNTGTLGRFFRALRARSHFERSAQPYRPARAFALRIAKRASAANMVPRPWPGLRPPCQLQNAHNFETMGIVSYQHTFSPDVVADFRGMVRDNANVFNLNADSTPILVFQHNSFPRRLFQGQRHHPPRPPRMESQASNPTILSSTRISITSLPISPWIRISSIPARRSPLLLPPIGPTSSSLRSCRI